MKQEYKELLADVTSNGKSDADINEVNGIPLPQEYLDFIHVCNGGEGNLGKNAYIQIYPLEELDEVNRDYEIQEYLPGYFVWGTDLGGMLFGYSQKTGMYSAVDSVSLSEEDLMYEESSLLSFLRRWDAELE